MGLIDSGGSTVLGLWQVVVPTGTTDTNYVTNPSFEVNTTGWTATSSTLTRTAGAGVFGAYGGRMLASASNGKVGTTLVSVASGTHGVGSAWVRATSPLVQIKVTIGANSAVQFHPGDGQPHRIEVPVVAPSTTTPVVEIIDTRTSAWDSVDVDGVQFETGRDVASTYIDGDQDGCTWTSTVHGSTSTRDGRDGRGGVITSFSSLGLNLTQQSGLGLPPTQLATLTYGISDGAAFTRETFGQRILKLQSEILYATGRISDLHTARAAVISALNLDKRTNRAPILLRYLGASTSKRVRAYYESGLEQQAAEPTVEVVPLQFRTDPDWNTEVEAQQALNTVQSIASVNGLAYRSPAGIWSTMGSGYTPVASNPPYQAVRLNDGRIVLISGYLNMGGVTGANYLAVWDGSTWSTLGGTAPNQAVYCSAMASNGDLYIGGNFTSVGGVSANRVAKWTASTNTWSALSTGANSQVFGLALDPNTGILYLAGLFTTLGGVAAAGAGSWNGSAFTSMAAGWPASSAGVPTWPQGFGFGPDGRLYTSAQSVYAWTGSTWTTVLAVTGGTFNVNALLNTGGRLYVGGPFTNLGGVTTTGIASWNGSSVVKMGSGLSASFSPFVLTLGLTADGTIIAAGNWATIGGVTTPISIAQWNGSSWSLFPATLPASNTPANDFYFVWPFADGSLVAAWFTSTAGVSPMSTTLTAPGITTVTNGGTAVAYPVVRLDSIGSLYSIQNLTTGQSLTFNGLSIASGEVATLDLRPGRKSFASATRDLTAYIQPSSPLATFGLVPGSNTIAVYAAAGSGTIRWTTRYWSADG